MENQVHFRPVLVALKEDLEARSVLQGEFGLPGAVWWTSVDLTLADELHPVRGRGWSGGTAEWVMPWGKHPVTIGLDCSITVVSTATPDQVLPLELKTLPMLRLESFDLETIRDHVAGKVRALGDVEGDDLQHELEDFLIVFDPDDDRQGAGD